MMAGLAQAQLTFNTVPSRIVGQTRLKLSSAAPNLVEGREFLAPQGLALDTSMTPPALYVADSYNNRVLGFRNATGFQNGAMADLVIGQPDRFTTTTGGPGTPFAAGGFNEPIALAVDAQGSLYVVDALNNRIVRFPQPFSQPSSDMPQPDFVIGQSSFHSSSANPNGVTATSIYVGSGTTALRAYLAFDSQGNLWFADAGNNRVLRYPASALAAGSPFGPAADLVLGQTDFVSNKVVVSSGVDPRKAKGILAQPSGLAFDPGGRLFVSDGYARALVFVPPFQNGQSAARVLGVPPTQSGTSEYTLGLINSSGSITGAPEGIFMVDSYPWVIDTPTHRVVRYDPYDQWPSESSIYSPPAKAVLGQIDFVSGKTNAGQPLTSQSGLSSPVFGQVVNNELYLVDAGNNRVMVYPVAGTIFGNPSRVLGQDSFNSGAPNLVEGREFYFTGGVIDGAGLAVDAASTPPRLYVADTNNNRILGFKDARNVRPGDKADLVIGQPDFVNTAINWPKNDSGIPNNNTLFLPKGLAVDSSGALWVADEGNGRVLRFPSPFNQPAGQMPTANLVIGQSSFYSQITDPSSRTMASPYGLGFTVAGDLLVSDAVHNRVLFFRKPVGGDFTSGQSAEKVLGQPDFTTVTSGSTLSQLYAPRHIAVDTDDHLYVADTGNRRVVVFDRVGSAANGATAAKAITSFSSPQGVYISPTTGEVWVADAGLNALYRFSSYDNLLVKPDPQASISSNAPLAVTLDGFGNLIAAEAVNRVAFWFPGLSAINAANYAPRPLAPGTIASIYPKTTDPNPFGTKTDQVKAFPAPTTMADLQVTVNDTPSPLFYAGPTQINFVVPSSAPTQGTADINVLQVSTGRVMASATVQMAPVSPGLFTALATGVGQVSAINYHKDGKVDINSASAPAAWGDTVQLYGTGQGLVANMPPDGVATPDATSVTAVKPRLFLNTAFYDSAVTFSGLAPSLVGVWVVNFVVPDLIAPGPAVQVLLVFGSEQTNIDKNGSVVQTTIAVKQP